MGRLFKARNRSPGSRVLPVGCRLVQQSLVRGASGEYRIYSEIGVGGMASVHLARFLGKAGFARTVAIKRPLPALQQSVDFRRLATREALLAARVQHPHVVSTFDVIDSGDEFLIVMQYVHGEPLSALTALAQRRGERVPVDIAVTLLGGVLRGLSAVHQARDERGRVLGLIHRDVSPQNILCGVDGVARLADFGLAKAAGYTVPSNAAEFKGKLTYASPEQVELGALTLATDLYAVGVVLWELLSGERMYRERTAPELVAQLLRGDVVPPSRFVSSVPSSLDAVVLRALAREPQQRYESALAMAAALESCVRPASVEATAAWVCELAAESLQARARLVIDAESETSPSQRQPAQLSAGPLDLTVPAGNAEDWLSSERDRGRESPSSRAGAFTKVSLRIFAMAAGVGLVWFLGEQLLPPPTRGEPRDVRAGDAMDVPTPPAVLSLRARGEPAAGIAPARAGAAPDAGAPSSDSSIDGTNTARRREGGRARTVRARSGAAGAGSVDCSPPFSLDAEGIRHMKPGCK
jgi:eukaryotic-like serine/threonine-protein kinase